MLLCSFCERAVSCVAVDSEVWLYAAVCGPASLFLGWSKQEGNDLYAADAELGLDGNDAFSARLACSSSKGERVDTTEVTLHSGEEVARRTVFITLGMFGLSGGLFTCILGVSEASSVLGAILFVAISEGNFLETSLDKGVVGSTCGTETRRISKHLLSTFCVVHGEATDFCCADMSSDCPREWSDCTCDCPALADPRSVWKKCSSSCFMSASECDKLELAWSTIGSEVRRCNSANFGARNEDSANAVR